MRKLDYRIVWLVLCFSALLQGCANTNPIAAAETPEQRAYAAYGTFVIFQETAADLVEQDTLSNDVRLRIIEAEERAKPAADSLLNAYVEFLAIRAEFEEGTANEETLEFAINNLNSWVTRLAPLVNELARNLRGAQQ